MRQPAKALLCAAASSIALGTAMPALAQAKSGAAAPANDPADIIVTARRTEERLQDVPISITVFNQQQLDNRNVTNATDLAAYTPSLSANARFGSDNASFAIRGFAQESRTTASVGVYFADVVAPRGGGVSIGTGDGAGPGSFFDLNNVQVLKGPQGTLQGRNTTGGAVLLVPKKPTSRFEGYVEGSYGNYDMKRVQAVVNVPLMDSARLRIGVDRMLRDGYQTNISSLGPRHLGNTDYWAARVSLVVDLLPNLENYTIGSYSRSDTFGALSQLQGCNPLNFPGGVFACQQIQRQQGRGLYAVDSSIDNPRSLFEQWQIINTTTWRASDTLTVKNITSYSQIFNQFRQDFFGLHLIVPTSLTNPNNPAQVVTGGALAGQNSFFNTAFQPPGGSVANQSNFTEELQFQGNAFGDKLTWQAGGYMELSDPLGDNTNYAATRLICADRFTLQCVAFPGLAGTLSVQKFRTSFHNYALYSQASYALTAWAKLTGGIRYTWDTTRGRAYNVQTSFPAGAAPVRRCANPTLAPGTTPITNNDQCIETPQQKSKAPTWLIGLDLKPIDNMLVYGKYSRGYRQGGVNPLAAGGFTTYGAEKVDAYEIGAKTSWRGALPGFLNVAGFYNDLSNQQLALGLTSTLGAAPNNAIVNIGKSRLKGVEVEAGIGPFHGFRVDASYAYIDARLRSSAAPVFPVGSLYNGFNPLNAGARAPYTPKNKYSITGSYTLPIDARLGRVTAAVTYTHTGSELVSQTLYGSLKAYSLLNANVNWDGVAGLPIDLSLFATNLTQQKYQNSVNDMFASSAFVSYVLGQPRMYGVRLRYKFGG